MPVHLDSGALTQAREERSSPNLLLLVFLFISLVVTGGLMAWLRAGPTTPKRADVVTARPAPGPITEVRSPPAAPRMAEPTPVIVRPRREALPNPAPRRPLTQPTLPRTAGIRADLVPAVVRPQSPAKVPEREVVQNPDSKTPAAPEVLHLRAQFTLEGGGFLSSIHVDVLQDGRCATLAKVNAGIDGRVCVEVSEPTGYLLVATAPGHAWATKRLDLHEGEQDAGAPVELPLTREYLIDVVDLDLSPREVETRRVRAGNFLQDLRFSQEGAALHATNTRGSCELRALGTRPLEELTRLSTPARADAECDFGLEPGTVFAVRQGTRWFAVRQREPGYLPPQLEGPRRVVKPVARR